ncbi:MAG: maleylpyruvate isomerase family mycothiol-dependent enzyme [Candidatus Dormibacteria bacterium]
MSEAATTIDLLEGTWKSIGQLCHGLDEQRSRLATDCPGWTVRDQIAHVIGSERGMRGEAPPDVEVTTAHVHNPLGAFNERWVVTRRDVPFDTLLVEYHEIAAERIAEHRALTPDQLSEIVPTPAGRVPLADFIDLRVFDCFTHEQDIRRALGAPGRLDSEEARRAVRRMAAGLPRVVARIVGAPDGTRARFRVEGPAGGDWTVVVDDRRGRLQEGDVGAVMATLVSDVETFLCLCAGRWSAERVLAQERLQLESNTDFGHRIAQRLTLVP